MSSFSRLPVRPAHLALSVSLLALLAATTGAGAGETITYDGTNPALLHFDPTPAYSSLLSLWPQVSPSGNTVTVTGTNGPSDITARVYGGYSIGGVNSNDNRVTVTGGTIGKDVMGGGVAGDIGGDAVGNTVTIAGSASVVEDVVGGFAHSGAATGNSVTLDGASIGGVVYGGAGSLDGSNNTVVVGGAAASVGQTVVGGNSWNGATTGNTVTINGGTITGDVIGGNSNNGMTSNNVVTINGGTVQGSAIGGLTYFGAVGATGNAVTIGGGTVHQDVIGGMDYYGTAGATGNTVTITGGTIEGSVYAGASISSFTTGNTLVIRGGTIVGGLSGGYGYASSDTFTGNTLDLHVAGKTVASLSKFQYLNFYLPTTVAAGDVVLQVTGTAKLVSNSTGASSVVNVGIDGASSALRLGDRVTLIHAAGGLITSSQLNTSADGTGLQGVTLKYVFALAADATDLTATVTQAEITEGSKALSEGRLAGMVGVTRSADLAADQGITQAAGAAANGIGAFTALSGGSTRTQTGSHVDLGGVALMAGLAKGFDVGFGNLTTGAFVEYGNGTYDTFNAFTSGNVHGHGNASNVGFGLLGRLDFAETGPGHAYVDGTARIGRAFDDFHSADLIGAGGVAAGWKSSSTYWGASAALGWVWKFDRATSLDLYGRWSWSRLDGDTLRLTTGETVSFAATDSNRSRLGARFSWGLSDGITPYVGAAWEHEFDGVSRATSNGYALAAPSARGDTGIGELGLTVRPSASLPLTVEGNLRGLVGRTQGVIGGLQAKWTF